MSQFRALQLAALFLPVATGLAGPPADPQLNPRGRVILDYFQQLQAGPELRLLSGQFCGWSGTTGLEELEKIHRATGHWPALIGLDYCDWSKGHPTIDVRNPDRLAQTYWQAGGLVTISWHSFNPANPEARTLRDNDVSIANLLVAGTPAHDHWIQALDHIAGGLQELQAAGVVVLWRPLHEMNGDWFWWGAQPPADYIKVWRHMFDYFTQTKGLHNLIWVYSPNKGAHAGEYYPGDGYADLVGLDAYTDFVDPAHVAGYTDLARLAKPFGFTEFGPHGSGDPPGDYDFRRLLVGVAQNFPHIRFFLCWNDRWNPAENQFAREFYADPRVITRADLPAELAGGAAAGHGGQ